MITKRATVWLAVAAAVALSAARALASDGTAAASSGSPGARVSGGPVVELDPARVRYELSLEQGTETVLARYRLRPGVLLGVEL